jgi:large subunit ribosomal protein L6
MTKIEEKIQIPEGISCTFEKNILTCKKDSLELSRRADLPKISLTIKDGFLVLQSDRSTKTERKIVHTFLKHFQNMFQGLNEKFTYKLEAANVHFPMTLKVDGNKITITNFLGEKVPRHAKISPNTEVEVKGQQLTISSYDIEAAGQTAANIEQATKVKGRDRRIFQDGIYITHKPEKKK